MKVIPIEFALKLDEIKNNNEKLKKTKDEKKGLKETILDSDDFIVYEEKIKDFLERLEKEEDSLKLKIKELTSYKDSLTNEAIEMLRKEGFDSLEKFEATIPTIGKVNIEQVEGRNYKTIEEKKEFIQYIMSSKNYSLLDVVDIDGMKAFKNDHQIPGTQVFDTVIKIR